MESFFFIDASADCFNNAEKRLGRPSRFDSRQHTVGCQYMRKLNLVEQSQCRTVVQYMSSMMLAQAVEILRNKIFGVHEFNRVMIFTGETGETCMQQLHESKTADTCLLIARIIGRK
jgi:hypothetical protein